MIWTELDWTALDRLREGFLTGKAGDGPYWKSASELASYDLTYGERIGWKWDHVIRELKMRGWAPSAAAPLRSVLDWGCGSGVAGRRVISAFGAESFDALQLWDHSPAACDFAADAATRAFPKVDVQTVTPGFLAGDEPIGLLLVSHVLNELGPDALAALKSLVTRAQAVIWVEPGTHDVSRALGALRDAWLAEFSVIAPCTHRNLCPALAPGRERDWCHFFAPAPAEIFANTDWVKFGQRAGIDLRSLPYCFIALERSSRVATPEGLSRVIGRPEHFKPYARLLNCDAAGLADLTLPKRADPALFKELDRTKAPLIYRWRREGETILGGEALRSG
ncbi:MAG: Ribosomal small subunit Rsm22 [Verrucomicrobia bacterium]|nr:Ribosomal small subunit Rsm22 [Verrucomicrobiota bacterium]